MLVRRDEQECACRKTAKRYLMHRQSNILHLLDARKMRLEDISELINPQLVEIMHPNTTLGSRTMRKSHYENVNGMHRNEVVPMMIHLGKHMLGQTEKSEATEADDLIDELRQEREAGQSGNGSRTRLRDDVQ